MARLNKFLAPALASVIVLSACGGGSSGSSPDSGGGGGSGGSAAGGAGGGAGGQGGGSGGQSGDAGPAHDGGMSDAGGSDAGGNDAGAGDAGQTQLSTAVLDSATAHVVGRRGRDVEITFSAHDPNKAIAAVMVTLLDSSGNPVLGFDSHQSGNLDSALGPASLNSVVTGSLNVDATATLAGLALNEPEVASLQVSLRDLSGNSSNELTAAVVAQSVASAGGSCDTNYVTSRCPETFYCNGAPATCEAAPPPQITDLAYLTGDAGPSIRIKGTAQADDVANMHVAFEDGGGQSISIPLNGTNDPSVSSFDEDVTNDASNGVFFVLIEPVEGFDQLCPQIAVTPSDETGAAGSTLSTTARATPIMPLGAQCDLDGFNACAPATVCEASASGASGTCAKLATAQTAACTAAPVLAPTSGETATTFGQTVKTSLWNAPDGCSSNNPTGTPIGLATLHLAADAATVTLSTDNPGTNFDTILYLLPGCPADSSAALGCNDDDALGADSLLTLQSVPAGDYTVVVGSFDSVGGNYQLTAQVQ